MTTDPRLTAVLDQSTAAIREAFAEMGVNLADPNVRRVVSLTTYAIANLGDGEFEAWIRAVNHLNETLGACQP